jgi:hypothetical protein
MRQSMDKFPPTFGDQVAPDLEELLRDGISAAKAGNNSIARSLLLQATEYDSDAEIGWLWLAYIAENEDQSIQYFRRTLELNPYNEQAKENLSRILMKRGVSFAKSGDNIEAKEFFLEATSLNTRNESAWMWLALVAADAPEAEIQLKKVLEISPENQYALSLLESLQNPAARTADDEEDGAPGSGFEPEWLPKPASRVAAENRITELLDDIYTSLHVVSGADKIQAEVQAAKERVSQLEELLVGVQDNLLEESTARESAQAQILEIKEKYEQMLREKDAAILKGEDEFRVMEEKLTKVQETETWAQEIGSKWIEEADARKSAERRVEALRAELKRVESIMSEAETAMSDFNIRIEKEYEARARIELSREGAENREKIAIKAKEEAEARIRELEERLRQLDSEFASEAEKRKKLELETADRQVEDIFSESMNKRSQPFKKEAQSEASMFGSFSPLDTKLAILRNREDLRAWAVRILIGVCLPIVVYLIYRYVLSG